MTTRAKTRELGEWMEDRRLELGLTWKGVAAAAGLGSEEGLKTSRNGGRGRALTRRGIERALRWESGSVDRILAGGKPVDEPPVVVADDPADEPDPEVIIVTREQQERMAPEVLAALRALLGEAERNRKS